MYSSHYNFYNIIQTQQKDSKSIEQIVKTWW